MTAELTTSMPHGVELRIVDVSDAANVDGLFDLVASIEADDADPDPTVRSELHDRYSAPHVDPTSDVVVARRDGVDVGWASTQHRRSGVRLERAFLQGGVLAAHRGCGIGRALLGWAERRARNQLEGCDPALPQWLIVEAHEAQRDRRAMQQRAGFDEARWFIDMKRPLGDSIEAEAPAGIAVVPWGPEHNDAVRNVNAASFADHWGSTPLSEDAWHHMLAEQATRLDLSFVALDGDEVVAYSFNEAWPEADPPGERIAWVGSLGTLRSHRRRGIARSLLDHSHARFYEAGFTHAMLDVDADSPSNAGSIYVERGYSPVYRTVLSAKVL